MRELEGEMSDLIDRQAAIDEMTNTLWHYPNECYRNLNNYEFAKGLAELGLKSVPAAQPERKKGTWIHDGCKFEGGYDRVHCSESGHLEAMASTRSCCHNCGADMRGEQE